MSETAISALMKAPEEINPLLEILWEIEQYQRQGIQLIELSEIGVEDCSEATAKTPKTKPIHPKDNRQLKKSKPDRRTNDNPRILRWTKPNSSG